MTDNLTQSPRTALKTIILLGAAGVCAAVLSLTGIFLYLDPQIPRAESYRRVQLETPLRVFAADGALLAEYGERRLIPVRYPDIPEDFINALLDTEDKRFFQHSGIDFISLTNDVFGLIGSLLAEGELGPGASTITMQLARNVSFTLEKRFLRKFKEMLLALKIEQELEKEEILELYINIVPFGKRAYGAQAAAMTYYGKPLQALNLAQLAMLAGIPQRPSANNPINGPDAALRRRNLVLARMLAQGSINDTEYHMALAEPITAQLYQRELDVPSPYAAEWVRQQAAQLLPDLYTGGYEIVTTIDSRLQAEAIAALRRGLVSYDHRHGYRGAEGRASEALVAALPAAGTALTAPEVPAEIQEQMRTLVREQPIYGGLEPALVGAVDDAQAQAMRADGSWVVLPFDAAGWARPYIEVDLRGPAPQTMRDVLAVGDIIRIGASQAGYELAQLPDIQGALVSLDPNNGAVRAVVGGYDFYRNQYNHALQAARQPGSGFKPFVYAAALANGVKPSDIFMDAPLVFDDENLETQYRPGNDNSRYNGPTRLREALYRSINLVSMRVLLEVGAGRVLDYVPRFGFPIRDFPRNTQLAIGGGTMAVTPLDMARAYAVLANTGYLIEPHVISEVRRDNGEILFSARHPSVCGDCVTARQSTGAAERAIPPAEPSSLADVLALADETEPSEVSEAAPELEEAPRVIDERVAYIMHSMLQDVIRRGTGRAARRLQRNDLAGKTGTTNDAADTWFNGYTPDLVTTVWVGFSNHAPLGARAYGSNTPLPIWIDFMEDALDGRRERLPDQPPGIVTVKIDPRSGALADPDQTNAIFEYFLSEHAPRRDTTPPSSQEEVKAIDLF